MEQIVEFRTGTCDADYVQLVKVSGPKSIEQFFQDLSLIEKWWKNKKLDDVGEDDFINKFIDYGWKIEFICPDINVTF